LRRRFATLPAQYPARIVQTLSLSSRADAEDVTLETFAQIIENKNPASIQESRAFHTARPATRIQRKKRLPQQPF